MCSKTALTTITQLWDGKNRLILHAGSWEFFSTLAKKRALNSEKRGASLRPLTSCFFTWLSCYGKVDHHSRIGKSESLDFPNSRKPTTSTQTSKTQGTRQRSCYVGLFDDVRTKESPLLLSHKGNLLLIQPKMLKVGGKTFLRSKVSFDLFFLSLGHHGEMRCCSNKRETREWVSSAAICKNCHEAVRFLTYQRLESKQRVRR